MGRKLHEIKIGNLKLKNRFLLAPMLEPNDIAFRMLCKKAGCALTYTGMTSVLSKKEINVDDKPAMQIFASSTKGVKKFMKKYNKNVSLWDLNLGCPSEIARKMKHGAFSHDLKEIEEILKIMRMSTTKPVTIKMRKTPNAFEIVKIAEKYADAIAVHPRMVQQGYSGEPDYDFALKIKKETDLPVIYSGNVDDNNAEKILRDFDFVFIGRNAIGRPEIFSKLTGKKSIVNFEKYLILAKKFNLPFRQVKYQAMNFSKGGRNAKKLRAMISKAKNTEELEMLSNK